MMICDKASHAAYVAEFAKHPLGRDAWDGFETGYAWDTYCGQPMVRSTRKVENETLRLYGVEVASTITSCGWMQGPTPYHEKFVLEIRERAGVRGGLGPTPLHDPAQSPIEIDYRREAGGQGWPKLERPVTCRVELKRGEGKKPTQGETAFQQPSQKKRRWRPAWWPKQYEMAKMDTRRGRDRTASAGDVPQWWLMEARVMHGGHGIGLVLMDESETQPKPRKWGGPEDGDPYEERFTKRRVPFQHDDRLEVMVWWGFGNRHQAINVPLRGVVEEMAIMEEIAESIWHCQKHGYQWRQWPRWEDPKAEIAELEERISRLEERRGQERQTE